MKKIYIFALIFALLTGIAIYSYAQHLQASLQVEKGSVVVAVTAIPANTLITNEMVAVKKLPEESINSVAVKDASLVVGRITGSAIEKDEQILSSRLNEKGSDEGGLSFTIPSGKRAITIEVNDISGVAGYIKKSNRVDVLATLIMKETVGGETKDVTKSMVLLQNIEVLELNSGSSEEKTSGYKNITLAVNPDEAVKLFYAQTNGKFTVVLRPVLETNLSSVSPYSP